MNGKTDTNDTPGSTWDPGESHRFERAKASFEQNFQQFRNLNDQMNRIPAFAVTLTAGFWYVAVVSEYGNTLGPLEEKLARFALMLFAGICDLVLVGIAIRIRDVMDDYLDRVRRFEGEWWTERTPSIPMFKGYSMVSMYSILILAGTAFSWGGAFLLFWPREAYSLWCGAGVLGGMLGGGGRRRRSTGLGGLGGSVLGGASRSRGAARSSNRRSSGSSGSASRSRGTSRSRGRGGRSR